MELMALLYDILQKARKEGLMAIEKDVEEPHELADLPEVRGRRRRPPRGRVHHRLPAHDGLGQPELARDREPDGQRDRDPSPRGARPGRRAAAPGRRAAGLRHRRGGARRGQHHGLGRPAAGDPRRHDRLGAGRHLPRHPARLRRGRAARRPARAEGRRRLEGAAVHQDDAARLDAGLRAAGGGRVRPQGALFDRAADASPSSKATSRARRRAQRPTVPGRADHGR